MECVAPFLLHTPQTLREAVSLLALPGARAVAGGTDLLPNRRHGLGSATALVDVTGIRELCNIGHGPGGTTIGAGVSLARLASVRMLPAELSAVREAALAVAGPAHRNAGTLGGNLLQDTRCVFYNQSAWWRRANAYCLKEGGDTCHVAPQGAHCHAAFAGDVAPALLVLDTVAIVAGPAGTRECALAELYNDDGAAHLALGRGDVLVAVRIPCQSPLSKTGYRKARARAAIDFPLAGAAVRIAMREGRITELCVALTGTNSRPFVLDGTAALIDRAVDDVTGAALAKLVQRQVSPMRTTVTQANHRRQVAAVLVSRLTRELAACDDVKGRE